VKPMSISQAWWYPYVILGTREVLVGGTLSMFARQ
jgi:hypothetical protein